MKKQILVIEDDESIAEVISIVLRDEGYDIIVDSQGSFAQNHSESSPHIDLAIIDYVLPNTNGDVLIKQMRRSKLFKDTKIILMSASVESELDKLSQKLAIDGVLAKPFDVDTLLNAVNKLL